MSKSVTSAIGAAARAIGPAPALRAVDYLRVSTEDQTKGYGIAYTGKRTAAHILKKGWMHADTVTDEGESGTLPWQEREGATRVMTLAMQTPRPFDVVVVYETRAIGRKNRVFWEWVWRLQDLGVFVAVVDEDIDNTTEGGEARMRDKANEAFKELARIRERTQGGIQEKAELGEYAGGAPGYGYRIRNQGKKGEQALVVDECDGEDACTRTDPCQAVHEAHVLREARRFLVEHRGDWTKAAVSLNARGLVSRSGAPWSAPNLRGRLMNEDLLNARRIHRRSDRSALGPEGAPVWGPTQVIDLPPVFTAEEVAELRQHTATPRRVLATGRAYPVSGRIKSLCGRHYTGSSPAGGAPHYVCTGKHAAYPGGPTCSCSQLDARGVEAWAWREVCALLGDPAKLRALADEWTGQANGQKVDFTSRLAALDRRIAEHDNAIGITMTVAAKLAARQGLTGPEAEAAVDRAIRSQLDEVSDLRRERGQLETWQAEATRADARAQDLQALADRAGGTLEALPAARQAEFMELLKVSIELAGPPRPMARGLECPVGKWFRDRDRLVPALCDHTWGLIQSAERFPGGGTVPRQKGGLDARTALDALLKKARTGVAWPALDAEYGSTGLIGHWKRWRSSGRWERVMELLADAGGVPPARRHPLPPLRMTGVVSPGIILAASVLVDHGRGQGPSAAFSRVAYPFTAAVAA